MDTTTEQLFCALQSLGWHQIGDPIYIFIIINKYKYLDINYLRVFATALKVRILSTYAEYKNSRL